MRKLFFVILLLAIGLYIVPEQSFERLKSKVEQILPIETNAFTNIDQAFTLKSSQSKIEINRDLSLYQIPIGLSTDEVKQLLGEPNHIDPSGIDFEWWIYNENVSDYIQLGVKEGTVNIIYSNGSEVSVGGLVLGDTYTTLMEQYPLNQQFEVEYEKATFTINQTEIDLAQHPIVMEDTVAIQFFIDIHDGNRIAGVQLMDIPTMLKVGNIAVSYRYVGSPPDISIAELTTKEQQNVNLAHERQILDLANTVRIRAGLGTVSWNNEAASVARSHSVDMKVNEFFAHDSPTTGSPFDRLGAAGITYSNAGENIAMGYRTAIGVHEGWMNSKGHRDNILKPEYTTLGVGALNEYYTQNFVTPR